MERRKEHELEREGDERPSTKERDGELEKRPKNSAKRKNEQERVYETVEERG